jgi:hypothetical protein
VGLPTYVAMESKPVNGCKIQNSCDGKCGLQLYVMKSAVDEIDGDLSDDLNHDTKILLDLIKP